MMNFYLAIEPNLQHSVQVTGEPEEFIHGQGDHH